MLGIEPDAEKNRLIFRDPVLPEWLPRVEVRGLRIRDSTLDVLAVRTAEGAVVEVLEQRGDAEIALEG
jgi:hypothetical protein